LFLALLLNIAADLQRRHMEQTMYKPDAPDIDIKAIHEAEMNVEFERQRKHQQKLRDTKCREIIPPEYYDGDESRFPKEWNQVKDWKYGKTGILFVGPTDNHKSFMACAIGKREFLAGHSLVYYDGIGFGVAVSRAFANPDITEDWLSKVCKADILIIDDLLKRSPSDVQAEGMYCVYERRKANLLPTITTLNASAASMRELMEKLTKGGQAKVDDIFEPLIRRIMNDTIKIAFTKKEKQK
jgi:DNA replication protein DnaC